MQTSGLERAGDDPFEGTPYRALSRLARGGMGEVFLVQHRALEKRFVAKILHHALASDPQLVDRFRLEAQAAARLNHENIVSVVGVGAAQDGRPFIIMEELNGEPLATLLAARRPLPVAEALLYAMELLSALSAVHAVGLVHRDIKPSNLFICRNLDGGRFLKVIDFGIARVLPTAAEDAPRPLVVPTVTGTVVGTPRYVSPEGAKGAHVDERADIYAAALVLYVMLTGRGPFDDAPHESMVLSAHVKKEPEPPSRFALQPVPPELDRIVLMALRKDPDDRFQSADAFAQALHDVTELFARPQGWLETTTFARSELASGQRFVAQPFDINSPELGATPPTVPLEQLMDSAPSGKPQFEPVRHQGEAEKPQRARSAHPRRHRAKPALILTFLLFAAAAAVAGAVMAGGIRIYLESR